MSRPAASRPRLSGPGELAAALPVLCGFPPQESLVVVALQGSSARVGLTARYDLPPAEHEQQLAADVVDRLRAAGARRAYLLVVTEQSDGGDEGLARARLVTALRDAVAAARGLALHDVLLVRDGRWWSYLCADGACCPRTGTALPRVTPALTLVRAEAALQGRAVLPSREALVTSLAGPAPDEPCLRLLRESELQLADELLASGRAAVRARLLQRFAAALARGVPADDGEAAVLALALHDVLVRDEVLTWALRRESALLGLLLDLARATPAPYDAPVCACLAWVAYGRGDGATAGIALERALATDPEHGLALLLAGALDRQVPPRQLRAVAVRAATARQRR